MKIKLNPAQFTQTYLYKEMCKLDVNIELTVFHCCLFVMCAFILQFVCVCFRPSVTASSSSYSFSLLFFRLLPVCFVYVCQLFKCYISSLTFANMAQ